MASGTSRILPNTVFRAAADVGSKLISVGFYVVIARKLGASAFGSFTFGLAFGSLVTVLAGFGQDAILTREVARDRRRVDGYFANTVALKLGLSVPVIALALLALELADMSATTRAVAILLSVAVLVELLTTTCFAVFQAYEQLGYFPVVIIGQRLFTAGVGIAAMAAGAGVETVAAIYLVGALLALILATTLLFRRVSPSAARDRHLALVAADAGGDPGRRRTRLPGDPLPGRRRDPAALSGSDREVGLYEAAYRLFEAPLFIGWAVAAAVYPVLSRLREPAELRLVTERALKLAIGATLLFALGAAILAGPAVKLLYGPEFHASARVLAWLAPTIMASTPSTMSRACCCWRETRRVGWRWSPGLWRSRTSPPTSATIPSYGMIAAAINTTVTEILLFLSLAVLVQRVTHGLDWLRLLGGPVLAGAVAAALMLALREHFPVAVVVGTAGYLGSSKPSSTFSTPRT